MLPGTVLPHCIRTWPYIFGTVHLLPSRQLLLKLYYARLLPSCQTGHCSVRAISLHLYRRSSTAAQLTKIYAYIDTQSRGGELHRRRRRRIRSPAYARSQKSHPGVTALQDLFQPCNIQPTPSVPGESRQDTAWGLRM